MVSTRRYQYIDLGSDEIVGRRRTFKDNGLSTGRGQVDMVVQYQYIEQARAPMQHYKFLDVAAEELRGSFPSPAVSEQQLLYSARPVRVGSSGLYSARYLLPPQMEEDPQAARNRAAKAAALADYTAEPPLAPPAVPQDPSLPEWGVAPGAAPVPGRRPAAQEFTPEQPLQRPTEPPHAPGRPPRGFTRGENGLGLDDPDVEERIRAAGRVPPPTPAPSPPEPSPLQAGGVPFTGRAPVAHRLFDDELEPEPVLERPPYRGPTPLNMDLPEPFVLKEEAVAQTGRLKRQRVSQEGDQFEGTFETYEEVAVFSDSAPMQAPAAQPRPFRAPQPRPGFQWIDPRSDEATVDRVKPAAQQYTRADEAVPSPAAGRGEAAGGFSWIDSGADEVKVDKMARHQRPTTVRPATRPAPPSRYIEEEVVDETVTPPVAATAARPPTDRKQVPVSALRPGASPASTADKTTVELAVEEAVATGVVEPDSETGPLAGTVVSTQEEEIEYEGPVKKPRVPVLPLPFVPQTPQPQPPPGKTPLPLVPKTPQPGVADEGAVSTGAPRPAERLRSSMRDFTPSVLPFVPRRREPERPAAQQAPDRAAVFEPAPAAPRRRRQPMLLPFIPSAPQAPPALPLPADTAGPPRPSARERFTRAFSRKKQPRAQPEVNVLPTPVLVDPTAVPPATEVPPAATVTGGPPPAGGTLAAAPGTRTLRLAVSAEPSLVPQRATGPLFPPGADEVEAVEFEEEKVAVAVPAVEPEAAGPVAEEFLVPVVPEELLDSEEYVLVPATPKRVLPVATPPTTPTHAEPEQASHAESAADSAREAAVDASQPAVYSAAIPPGPAIPDTKPAQMPKTGIVPGPTSHPLGASEIGAAEAEEYILAKNGLQSEPASPIHATREKTDQEQAAPAKAPATSQDKEATIKPPEAALEASPAAAQAPPASTQLPAEQPSQGETAQAPQTAAEQSIMSSKEVSAAAARALAEHGGRSVEEYEVPQVKEEPVTKQQKAAEEEALKRAAGGGGYMGSTEAQRQVSGQPDNGDDRLPLQEAYVVSTPEGIGAGNIITAAHDAEEHLSHGEPVRPEPPPHEEESAAKTILQEKEERMPRDQGTSANAAAAAKLQREGEVPTWPMFAAPEPAAAAESAWPSIEPMEMHEPQRATRGERGILDSGRDFETAQPEAAGSAPTSEAEFQHFRSPVGSFTSGTGVMDTFSSDTAFFDASEQIEPPPADAPAPSIPEERPAPPATMPPNYEGEMSYEERGLLRSYELNELRDRLAKEAAMQPPSQLPQQLAPAPTRPAAAGGGLAMPEGFTQDIDNEEARSKERLAAMADRSKSQLDETQERVAALAAQGLSSIEEQRSSGLSKLAALAEQQPKPAAVEAGSFGTAEARQRFVELEARRPTPPGGVPLPRDPGLASRQHHAGDSSKADMQGKAPASSGGLAAPAVRGHISPARAADDTSTPTLVTTQEPERRPGASLPELSLHAAKTTTAATAPQWAEPKDKGPALPETPASSSTVLPSPFGFAPPPESETSQRSAQTTEAIDTPRPADTAQSGAEGSGVGRVLITSPTKREGADKKGSTFKKLRKMWGTGGREKEGGQEERPPMPSTGGP